MLVSVLQSVNPLYLQANFPKIFHLHSANYGKTCPNTEAFGPNFQLRE